MSSSAPIGDQGKDFRPEFTRYLSQQCQSCSGVTQFVVSQMNQRMIAEGNKMTENHFKVATKSLGNGDSVCDFMRKENSDVLKSSGQGFFYTGGRYAHEGIRMAGFAKDEKKEKP